MTAWFMSSDVLLCGAAVIAWAWLVRAARVEWPHLKRMNDALGITTPRHVLTLVAVRRGLAPAGVLAAVVAVAISEARAGLAAGALATAALAMWCANEKTRRLLLRSPGPVAPGPGGWEDPGPDAPSADPWAPRRGPPALGHAVHLRASLADVGPKIAGLA